MRLRLMVHAVAATCVMLLASCGGYGSTSPYGGGGGGGGGHSPNISVRDFAFSPTPDTVPPGTVVTFTWVAGPNLHNVTWDSGPTTPGNSGDMSSGQYMTPALSAGTYAYHCTFHATLYNMRGTIVVK